MSANKQAQVKNQILSLLQSNRLLEARTLCIKYCNSNMLDADVWCMSAMVHGQLGQYPEAEEYARQAITLAPNHANAHFYLGAALFGLFRLEEAEKSIQEAIKLNPQNPNAHFLLGNIYSRCKLLSQEASCYQKALAIAPNSIGVIYAHGKCLNLQGMPEKAIECYDKALSLNPNHILSRFGKCVAHIPVIYRDEEHITTCRDNYHREIDNLSSTLKLVTDNEATEAAMAVGDQPLFYLSYQGKNDRDLQEIYGDLISRIQSRKYPQWSKKITMPPVLDDDRIRVGIVSRFFYNHSNWKIPIKGWIENIDKQRFSLYGYYTGTDYDEFTDTAKQSFDKFIEGTPTLEVLCKTIRDDDLHILIYPEIGMDQMTIKLAALRLAPVQCSSWGHPETSGLPTIDYFLSSDLMEPGKAEEHYTEKLIRLPNLSIYYEAVEFEAAAAKRSDFGLHADKIVYFCAQSLFKYLPQYDDIFPRIAKEVVNCQFAFIGDPQSSKNDQQFLDRMRQVFEQHNLNYKDYVVFLPKMDSAHYQAMNKLTDVFLDSIRWSGCNSAIEAIAYDTPIVTMPGDTMRSRHSYSFLTMMGVTDTVVDSLDNYVLMAVKLASDNDYRHSVSEKMAENKHRLYRDNECIKSLETFIEQAINSNEVTQ